MQKQKHGKAAIDQIRDRSPAPSDDPAHDDPRHAIDQELLGIWLSISRLRQLIHGRPPTAADYHVVRSQRPAWPDCAKQKDVAQKKAVQLKKPRRKAA